MPNESLRQFSSAWQPATGAVDRSEARPGGSVLPGVETPFLGRGPAVSVDEHDGARGPDSRKGGVSGQCSAVRHGAIIYDVGRP